MTDDRLTAGIPIAFCLVSTLRLLRVRFLAAAGRDPNPPLLELRCGLAQDARGR